MDFGTKFEPRSSDTGMELGGIPCLQSQDVRLHSGNKDFGLDHFHCGMDKGIMSLMTDNKELD